MQALCDADAACGGWGVVAGKATLVRPLARPSAKAAPIGSLLYTKHCGPWVDPPHTPTVWPLPATVATANATARLAPGFELVSASAAPLMVRALDRYTRLIFVHEVGPAPPVPGRGAAASAAPTTHTSDAAPLLSLQVVVAGTDSEELSLGTDESYTLTIPAGCPASATTDGSATTGGTAIGTGSCQVLLHCATVFGALRGLETFAQLVRFDYELESYYVPGAPVVISDQPRFAYRGLMLDVVGDAARCCCVSHEPTAGSLLLMHALVGQCTHSLVECIVEINGI
jgi:hypothetical protein